MKKGIPVSNVIEFSFDFGEDIDLLDSYFPDEDTRIHVKGTKNDYVVNAKKFRAYISERTRGDGLYYRITTKTDFW